MSRVKSVLSLGACAILLVIACTVSFGMVDFFTNFTAYGGANKSFFDVVIDVFYDTILPLNGFIICIFAVYHWKKANLNAEMSEGDDGFEGSFTQKYINGALGTVIPAVLLLVFINTVFIKFLGFSFTDYI